MFVKLLILETFFLFILFWYNVQVIKLYFNIFIVFSFLFTVIKIFIKFLKYLINFMSNWLSYGSQQFLYHPIVLPPCVHRETTMARVQVDVTKCSLQSAIHIAQLSNFRWFWLELPRVDYPIKRVDGISDNIDLSAAF